MRTTVHRTLESPEKVEEPRSLNEAPELNPMLPEEDVKMAQQLNDQFQDSMKLLKS